MSLTKVSYSMIAGAPINIVDFGADPTGVADSTATIQAVFDTYTSNVAIFIPAGTYKLTTNLAIDGLSNVRIYSEGGVFNTENVPRVTPKKSKVVFSNCDDCWLSGLVIEGNITDAEYALGDDVAQLEVTQTCQRFVIENCTTRPSATAGAKLNHGIAFYSNDGILKNNTIVGPGREFGVIIIRDRAQDGSLLVDGNVVENFYTSYEAGYDTSNINFTNNISTLADGSGVHFVLWAKGTSSGLIENINITNNTCTGGESFVVLSMGVVGESVADGIQNINISNNIVNKVTNGSYAILPRFLDDTGVYLQDILIKGNVFHAMEVGLISVIPPNTLASLNCKNIVISENVYSCVADTVDQLINVFVSDGGVLTDNVADNITVNDNSFKYAGTNSTAALMSFKRSENVQFVNNGLFGFNKTSGSYVDMQLLAGCTNYIIKNNTNLSKITCAGNYITDEIYVINNVGIKTENYGSATIPSGASTIVVNHGLESTAKLGQNPSAYFFKITPRNSTMGSAAYYLDNVYNTYFVVNTASSVGADATFDWELTFSEQK